MTTNQHDRDRMIPLRVLALEHGFEAVAQTCYDADMVLVEELTQQAQQIEQLNEDVRVLQQLVEDLLGDEDDVEDVETVEDACESCEGDLAAFLFSIIG